MNSKVQNMDPQIYEIKNIHTTNVNCVTHPENFFKFVDAKILCPTKLPNFSEISIVVVVSTNGNLLILNI